MATTPGGLTKAILARLRDQEALTGDAATARAVLAALVPKWRFGTMAKAGAPPCGNVFEDASVDAMPRAVDVGILQHSIRRFELWTTDTASSFFHEAGDALELLFDERRGAPELPIGGDGLCYEGALFVPMQAPYFDEQLNAWYGVVSFRFVEARP
jgi:hypothetical protein